MPTYTLHLAEPVVGTHVEELARRIYFVAESITGFRLLSADGTAAEASNPVTAVEVATDQHADPAELTRQLHSVVDGEVRPQTPQQIKVVWSSAAKRTPIGQAFAKMAAEGVLYEIAPGEVALGQPAIAALNALDQLLVDIAVGDLGAREYRYPTLLPIGALHRSGYLTSFPHHLMFASRLKGDVDTYRDFVRPQVQANIGEETLQRCAPVTRCLPPTMCYHTFHQLADSQLDTAAGVVITARGGAFRHESRYQNTMERLADFSIRETVFLGSPEFVRAGQLQFRELAIALVDRLGLSGRCEVANDPFFAGADGANRGSWQRLLELKHELHLDVSSDGSSVAVGSFNVHERHFGEAFQIRDPQGAIVSSACVGFGLERLTFAVLSQFGWDPAGWPDLLRDRATATSARICA